jgi:hypothetical protein
MKVERTDADEFKVLLRVHAVLLGELAHLDGSELTDEANTLSLERAEVARDAVVLAIDTAVEVDETGERLPGGSRRVSGRSVEVEGVRVRSQRRNADCAASITSTAS